jgi:hypothetical protein
MLADEKSRGGDSVGAERLFTWAIRGFWRLGDYPGIVHGHYRFGMALQRLGQTKRALNLVEDGLELAQREKFEVGVGFLEFATAFCLERAGQGSEAHGHFATAAAIGAKSGHLWLEAGSLQGLARTELKPSDRNVARLLRSLELVHWSGGGSAPAPWMVDMVNSFRAMDDLKRALGSPQEALEVLEANPFLAETGLDGPLVARQHQNVTRASAQMRGYHRYLRTLEGALSDVRFGARRIFRSSRS